MSLLYRSSGAIPAVDEKLCADLLLEETFSAIFPDDTRRRIFLAVLTNPLTDSADITRRAAILRDLIRTWKEMGFRFGTLEEIRSKM